MNNNQKIQTTIPEYFKDIKTLSLPIIRRKQKINKTIQTTITDYYKDNDVIFFIKQITKEQDYDVIFIKHITTQQDDDEDQ